MYLMTLEITPRSFKVAASIAFIEIMLFFVYLKLCHESGNARLVKYLTLKFNDFVLESKFCYLLLLHRYIVDWKDILSFNKSICTSAT